MCLDQPSKWLDKETKVLVSDMYMDSFVDYAETGFPGGASGKESACQNRTKRQVLLVCSLGWEDPLQEGKATHSSILAWRIPWTEEPSGLQSIGWQRVGHG